MSSERHRIGGVTSFTRNNVTASIGSNLPFSVFPYYRSVMFANAAGFYGLFGASPAKALQRHRQDHPSYRLHVAGLRGEGFINNILCAAFLFTFNGHVHASLAQEDPRHPAGSEVVGGGSRDRTCYLVFLPLSGAATLFGWDTNKLYQLFNVSTGNINSRVQTKLWDGGEPILDKQILRGAVGVTYGGSGGQVITAMTDTRTDRRRFPWSGATSTVTWLNSTNGVVQWQNSLSQNVNWTVTGYVLSVGASTSGGHSKYMGLDLDCYQNKPYYNLFGLEYKTGARW